MSNVDLSWLANMSETERNAFLSSVQQQSARDAARQTPGRSGSTEQNDAFGELESYLYQFGLQARNDRSEDRLSVRLWNYIVDNGIENQDALWLWIQKQNEFKVRFPAFDDLQAQDRAVTPAQYIALENGYREVMRASGVPTSFFDQPDDFTKLIRNGVSVNEFQQRVTNGFQRVAKADPLVRDAFKKYFGVEGDAALAAFFIDPLRSAPMLERAVQVSEINAAAQASNMNIDLRYASRLAGMGVTYQDALRGMAQIERMSALFEQGLNETQVNVINPAGSDIFPGAARSAANDPMTQEERLGVATVFGTDSEAAKEIQLRLEKRKAAARGERTQVVTDKTGRTSLGSADK